MAVFIPSFRNRVAQPGLNAPAGVGLASAGQALGQISQGLFASSQQKRELSAFADQFQESNPQVANILRTQEASVPLISFGAGGAGGGQSRGGGGSGVSSDLLRFALNTAQSERDFEESKQLQKLSQTDMMNRIGAKLANDKVLAQERLKTDIAEEQRALEGKKALAQFNHDLDDKEVQSELKTAMGLPQDTSAGATKAEYQSRMADPNRSVEEKQRLQSAAASGMKLAEVNVLGTVEPVEISQMAEIMGMGQGKTRSQINAKFQEFIHDPETDPALRAQAIAASRPENGSKGTDDLINSRVIPPDTIPQMQAILNGAGSATFKNAYAREQMSRGVTAEQINDLWEADPSPERVLAGDHVTKKDFDSAMATITAMEKLTDEEIDAIGEDVMGEDVLGQPKIIKFGRPDVSLRMRRELNLAVARRDRFRAQEAERKAKEAALARKPVVKISGDDIPADAVAPPVAAPDPGKVDVIPSDEVERRLAPPEKKSNPIISPDSPDGLRVGPTVERARRLEAIKSRVAAPPDPFASAPRALPVRQDLPRATTVNPPDIGESAPVDTPDLPLPVPDEEELEAPRALPVAPVKRTTYKVIDATRDTIKDFNKLRKDNDVVSLDFNHDGKKISSSKALVVIPNDASPELIKAAKGYIAGMKKEFGIPTASGGKHGSGIRTRSENGRGMTRVTHLEGFYGNDPKVVNAIKKNPKRYADIIKGSFGKLSSTVFIPPHTKSATGAATNNDISETEFAKKYVIPNL